MCDLLHRNPAIYRILRHGKYVVLFFLFTSLTWLRFVQNGFRRKTLCVLYLYADTQAYPTAYARLLKILKTLWCVDVTIVRIDNFHEQKDARKVADNVYEIGGDNRFWEFSGWKKGIRFLLDNGLACDFVLFVNDAFLNESDAGGDESYFRRHLCSALVLNPDPMAAGALCEHEEREVLKGVEVSSWLRSNFILMPYDVATQLELTYLSAADITSIFPREYEGYLFRRTALLNDELRRFLEAWIRVRWKRGQHVHQDNWRLIRAKMVAILNERLLTVQLRQMKVPIVNWHDLTLLRLLSVGLRPRAVILPPDRHPEKIPQLG